MDEGGGTAEDFVEVNDGIVIDCCHIVRVRGLIGGKVRGRGGLPASRDAELKAVVIEHESSQHWVVFEDE